MKKLAIIFFFLLPTHALAIDSEEEIGCLVEAVYFEARGESLAGKVAVINVILETLVTFLTLSVELCMMECIESVCL